MRQHRVNSFKLSCQAITNSHTSSVKAAISNLAPKSAVFTQPHAQGCLSKGKQTVRPLSAYYDCCVGWPASWIL